LLSELDKIEVDLGRSAKVGTRIRPFLGKHNRQPTWWLKLNLFGKNVVCFCSKELSRLATQKKETHKQNKVERA
jgi:hypothetical protein